MNPSASGWIDKFGVTVREISPLFPDTHALYAFLRSSGFIYGVSIEKLPVIKADHQLTGEELTKINLITAFYFLYSVETKNTDFKRFIKSLLTFYTGFETHTDSFLKKLFPGKKPSLKLERHLHSRVQIDENIFTKNFSKLLVNALLFIDVLAYRVFLRNTGDVLHYFKKLERTVIHLIRHIVNTKKIQTSYREQLVKLFEASLRYQKKDTIPIPQYPALISGVTHPLEKQYIVDIAAITLWEDMITEKEITFMKQLGNDLKMPSEAIDDAMAYVAFFYEHHNDVLPHFNNGHFVKNFYDNSLIVVGNLITRNKKRLQQELIKNRELMGLLSAATSRELSKEEKQKIKIRLIDIFKAIPSLAIFALPGGAVLLPIFVKLIPKLLPSSFDDNRID